jgi:hypothetical protein
MKIQFALGSLIQSNAEKNSEFLGHGNGTAHGRIIEKANFFYALRFMPYEEENHEVDFDYHCHHRRFNRDHGNNWRFAAEAPRRFPNREI